MGNEQLVSLGEKSLPFLGRQGWVLKNQLNKRLEQNSLLPAEGIGIEQGEEGEAHAGNTLQ